MHHPSNTQIVHFTVVQCTQCGKAALLSVRNSPQLRHSVVLYAHDGKPEIMRYSSSLPAPNELKVNMQALAVLDAILSPDWEYRYHYFNSKWGDAEQMGSIRNGHGDDVFVLFNDSGCFLKGIAHEYPSSFSPSGFYREVPKEFSEAVSEPAFSPENVSYCHWYLNDVAKWESSIPESSLEPNLFFLIQGLASDAQTYRRFAADYFEEDVDLKTVTSVLRGQTLTEHCVRALNPEINLQSLHLDFSEIGFPVE